MCRVQMGRGRCLVADKILRYLQNNSMIKIGTDCDAEQMSLKIDEHKGQRTAELIPPENEKSTENLQAKRRTCLPFKIKLKTITFWKDSWMWNKLSIFSLKATFYSQFSVSFESLSGSMNFSHCVDSASHVRKQKRNITVAHECRSTANVTVELAAVFSVGVCHIMCYTYTMSR